MCVRANIDQVYTGSAFTPIQTHCRLKTDSFSSVAVSLATRLHFGRNLEAKCACMSAAHFAFLWTGKADMTLSYLHSGRISDPQPKKGFKLFFSGWIVRLIMQLSGWILF